MKTYNYETILFELRDDGIGVLTLNRPDKLNSHNFKMCEDLHDLLDHLRDNYDCRILIMKAEGKTFCAGTDLNDVLILKKRKKPEDYVEKFYYCDVLEVVKSVTMYHDRIADVVVKMRRIPQPIISLIQGAAAGGGFSLTMGACIRIATNKARFACASINVGLTGGDMASSYLLPRLIGMSKALELSYTARFMGADEALHCGYLSQIVEEDKLLETGMALAQIMLKKSPLGLRKTKELFNCSLDSPSLETMVKLENSMAVYAGSSKDAAESVQAFFEKRDPSFPLR